MLARDKFHFLYPQRPTQANRLCPSLMTVQIQEGKVNTKEKEVLPNLSSTQKSLNDHNTVAEIGAPRTCYAFFDSCENGRLRRALGGNTLLVQVPWTNFSYL